MRRLFGHDHCVPDPVRVPVPVLPRARGSVDPVLPAGHGTAGRVLSADTVREVEATAPVDGGRGVFGEGCGSLDMQAAVTDAEDGKGVQGGSLSLDKKRVDQGPVAVLEAGLEKEIGIRHLGHLAYVGDAVAEILEMSRADVAVAKEWIVACLGHPAPKTCLATSGRCLNRVFKSCVQGGEKVCGETAEETSA